MNQKYKLKILLVFLIVFWASLAGYKAYLYVIERDYSGLNADNLDRVRALLKDRSDFSFAVLGNIRNSLEIFDKRMLPLLRDKGVDFMISAGNAVYDGAEDKYRLLSRGLRNNGLPYLLAVGENEVEDRGTERFYRHFGPLFFSFDVGGSCFIFLDTSGETSWNWQMRWLQRELDLARDARFRFVIMNRSIFSPPVSDALEPAQLFDEATGSALRDLFTQYGVTAVFSSGNCASGRRVSGGVKYFDTGCAGGLLLDDEAGEYLYLRVRVSEDGVDYTDVQVPHRVSPLAYKLQTLGLFLHSAFYTNFFNFLVILGIVGLLALKVYSLVVRQESLYRDFSTDEKSLPSGVLRVAMFTDNYLPFTGGVPISIHRLYKGLTAKGTLVRIFAPSYGEWTGVEGGEDVFRCRTFRHRKKSQMKITNIFSGLIKEELDRFDPDLVHVNHPYWLGWRGKNLARKKGLPVVFTYHTRLERYMHYIPIPGAPLKQILAHYLIKRFANGCEAIIAPTASTEEYLRRLGVRSMVTTIPTGVDFGEYERWSPGRIKESRERYARDGEVLLISISRLAKEKNLDFLIDGLAKVRDRSKVPFRCLMVGDGTQRPHLESKVDGLRLGDQIVFTGNLEPSDVAGACLASDIFVFASTSETQGMVLLEAMAGGCPVVAVSSSGVYDVIENGFNGFKVPESTDSWAEAVVRLLEEPGLRETFAANSREFALKYSAEKISDRVLSLYRNVLGLKGANPKGRGGK